MSFMPTWGALAVCAALLLSPAAASAAVTTFFGEDLNPVAGPPPTNIPNSEAARDAFFAALGNRWTYDAETPFSTPDFIDFTGPGGTISGQILGDATASSLFDAADYATSGISVVGGTEGWTLIFSQPLSAVGMFGIGTPGEDPQESQIRLEITFTNGDVEQFDSANTLNIDDPSVFYFGILDDARSFQQIQFRALSSTLVQIAVDDITVGTRIPEPAGAGLVLLGAGLLLCRRYRQTYRLPRM